MRRRVKSVSHTVMVVDYEILVRILVADILTEGGFHVLEAVNAREAAMILAVQPQVRAVITDVDMPGLSGLDFAKATGVSHPGVAIIIMSGAEPPPPLESPKAVHFVAKPFASRELIDTVQEAIAETAARALACEPETKGDTGGQKQACKAIARRHARNA